jgi:hypothetical protein
MAARKQRNGSDYANITYGSFGHKGNSRVVSMQPLAKDYAEMAKLLAARGGRPGPGQYADGLKKIYSISRDVRAGGGIRYEDGEWGKKRVRKSRFDDPQWKMQHMLAGSLHRLKSKRRPSSAPRQRGRGRVEEDTADEDGDEDEDEQSNQETGSNAEEDEDAVAAGATPSDMPEVIVGSAKKTPSQKKKKKKTQKQRLKSAHARRKPRRRQDSSLHNIDKIFQSKQATSFGPGFGSPLRTPIKKWRQANRINYLRSTSSTSDILKDLAQSNALEAKKKRKAQSSHRRRIAAPAEKETGDPKKELTTQQMIRRLPKYYDPKKDPAMVPKILRGGGIAPLSSLNVRQKKLLELARIRARQPRSKRSQKAEGVTSGGKAGAGGNKGANDKVVEASGVKASSTVEKGQKDGQDVRNLNKASTDGEEEALGGNPKAQGGGDSNNNGDAPVENNDNNDNNYNNNVVDDSDQESDDEYSAGV